MLQWLCDQLHKRLSFRRHWGTLSKDACRFMAHCQQWAVLFIVSSVLGRGHYYYPILQLKWLRLWRRKAEWLTQGQKECAEVQNHNVNHDFTSLRLNAAQTQSSHIIQQEPNSTKNRPEKTIFCFCLFFSNTNAWEMAFLQCRGPAMHNNPF